MDTDWIGLIVLHLKTPNISCFFLGLDVPDALLSMLLTIDYFSGMENIACTTGQKDDTIV